MRRFDTPRAAEQRAMRRLIRGGYLNKWGQPLLTVWPATKGTYIKKKHGPL